MSTVDEVNRINSPFIKSGHPKLRMKEAGRGQLWFALDEPSKVKHVNTHFTAYS
jgi:hypothetical protein